MEMVLTATTSTNVATVRIIAGQTLTVLITLVALIVLAQLVRLTIFDFVDDFLADNN